MLLGFATSTALYGFLLAKLLMGILFRFTQVASDPFNSAPTCGHRITIDWRVCIVTLVLFTLLSSLTFENIFDICWRELWLTINISNLIFVTLQIETPSVIALFPRLIVEIEKKHSLCK